MRRSYAGGAKDRLRADWLLSGRNADGDLRFALARMRNASRDLERNNGYVRKFLSMIETNVIGPRGIVLQARSRDQDETLDERANDLIQQAWAEWSEQGVCTVDGRLSWLDAQRIIMRSVPRDGEVLIRLVSGSSAGNRFNFALQVLEADHLDEHRCEDLRDGRRIWMGVEMDAFGRPVAYHVLNDHPGADTYGHSGKRYERIPADQILHPYVLDRPGQTRGVSWLGSAMNRLQMLGAYEEAELVAARVSAAKMGFYTDLEGASFGPDGDDGASDDGELVMDAEAGSFERLPPGVDFKPWDPQHPNSAFPDFRKAMLRGAAAGMGVSYNGLAADLEGVNYSSLRSGALEERDMWRVLQRWMIGGVHTPIFRQWLRMSLLGGAISLPYRKIDKFKAVEWRTRGWQWVDPDKDGKAQARDVGLGTNSRTKIAAEAGRDLEEVFEDLAREQAMARDMGVVLGDPLAGESAPHGGGDPEGEGDADERD
ncbi:MAG: phage portal protein [Alphaproteobacteria bacterium]|nr:phage portal protein [Alphaproteobacteria bacterium]